MVELTHGGTWLNWRSLSSTDRNWALLSFITSFLAALPIGLFAGEWGYRVGFGLGSGGRELHARSIQDLIGSQLVANLMLASAVLAIVSAVAWWRFSRNQDEMFNRIQNYAIAQAGGWTLALATVWMLLELGGWVAPLPLAVVVLFGLILLSGFWFYAVRRWL